MMMKKVSNGRLTWFANGEISDFWTNHWAGISLETWLGWGRAGELGHCEKVFKKYLPQKLPVLEAGCGVGQIVLALQTRGYDAVGIELSHETVSSTKKLCPSCNIHEGDILKLQYPDGFFGAYISLGVLEHFEDGMVKPLEEAYRVLKIGGIALISVPYFSPLRKFMARKGQYNDDVGTDCSFYQYAYTRWEFQKIVEGIGFNIIDWFYYDAVKGTKDEVEWFNSLYRRGFLPGFFLYSLNRISWYLNFASHMIMVIAEKKK